MGLCNLDPECIGTTTAHLNYQLASEGGVIHPPPPYHVPPLPEGRGLAWRMAGHGSEEVRQGQQGQLKSAVNCILQRYGLHLDL